VVRDLGTRLFMDATHPHPTPLYDSLMHALDERSIPVRQAERGRRIDLGGGAWATLLSPPIPLITRSRSNVNANSVVVRIDYGKIGILFAGDAEAPTERWLLADGAKLGAQVLKVAHHGSRYSSTAPFLRAVHPTIAVMSVGTGNDYGHPAPETIARLEKLGAQVLRTDLDGTVTVETDGERITVHPAHTAPRVSELR
jgi:beta-lactamase superfamily II metal-dependent hydrolase